MLSYCLMRRENTESKNPNVRKTKNGKVILLSKCAECGSKKSEFIKEQDISRFLSQFWIRTPLRRLYYYENFDLCV